MQVRWRTYTIILVVAIAAFFFVPVLFGYYPRVTGEHYFVGGDTITGGYEGVRELDPKCVGVEIDIDGEMSRYVDSPDEVRCIGVLLEPHFW